MTFYLPSTIDFEAIEKHFPPNFKPYKRDKLAYLLHKIATLGATNKNITIVDGYVPLYSKALKNIVCNYRKYLQYAECSGLIQIRHSYLSGNIAKSNVNPYSKSYRFVNNEEMDLIAYEVTDFILKGALNRHRQQQLKTVAKHTYLTKWFNKKLTIDYKKVDAFLNEEWLLKNDNPALREDNKLKKKIKSHYAQLSSAKLAAKFLVRGQYNLKIDGNVHRFHSNLTNMRGLIRNAITYDGQNLVSIDIKNSQPYFSTLLLREAFWSGQKKAEKEPFSCNGINSEIIFPSFIQNSKYNTIKINNIKDRIISNKEINKTSNDIFSLDNYIMLVETLESLINKGFDEDKLLFEDLVFTGQLYDYLEMEFKSKLGMVDVSRETAKAALFQAFFSDNRFIGSEDANPKRCFRDLFPSVYEVYAAIKRKKKNLLALLLQNIESYFIIDVIAKRIGKEYPDLPIFTIHDSIVTTVGNEKLVESIMNEELERGVGKAPSLKLEYWESQNIDDYLTDLKVRAGMLSA